MFSSVNPANRTLAWRARLFTPAGVAGLANRMAGRPWAWALVLAAICATQLLFRPAYPVDETRYLAVAWAMYSDGHWLVPVSYTHLTLPTILRV